MFKKILHPTDFSPVALHAFDQAVALSIQYGAELKLLHAVVIYDYDTSAIDKGMQKLNEAYELLRSELKNQLKQTLENSDLPSDRGTLKIKRGFGAGKVIIDSAREMAADLIVMGTHGHSPIRHFFLGSVAEKVMRYAPCPVMVLGKMEDAPARFDNILLPVDFSETSHCVANLAVSMAKQHRARLHLLHVYQDIVPSVYQGTSFTAFTWDPSLRKRGEESLQRFMERHQEDGVETVPHLGEGHVHREIVNLSNRESIDLIVMGMSGLTGVSQYLLGSTTDRVLRRADVPVLTVRVRQEREYSA